MGAPFALGDAVVPNAKAHSDVHAFFGGQSGVIVYLDRFNITVLLGGIKVLGARGEFRRVRRG